MKHCVLLKLAPGVDAEKVQHKVWKAYQKLDEELDWLNRPVIFRGCMDAASDFDLMAVVELDDEKQLEEYLRHPRTLKLAEELAEAVACRASFNHY